MKIEMIPTLRKSVEWAETEAQHGRAGQWFQGAVYVSEKSRARVGKCGAAYCIAGHIVAEHYGVTDPYVAVPGRSVMDHARDLLGLDVVEADDLFHGGNSIGTVREVAEAIAGERL